MANITGIKQEILERANTYIPGIMTWAELYPEVVEQAMPFDNFHNSGETESYGSGYAWLRNIDGLKEATKKSTDEIQACDWLSSAGFCTEEMKRILEIGGSAALIDVGRFSHALSRSFRTAHNVPVAETGNLLRQMLGKAPYLTVSHCRQLNESHDKAEEAKNSAGNTDGIAFSINELELPKLLHRAACAYEALNGTASAEQCHALNQDLGHDRIHQLGKIGLVSYKSLRRALDSGVLDIADELEENRIHIHPDEIARYKAFRDSFDPHSSIALVRAGVPAELAGKLLPHYKDAESIIAYHRAGHPADMAGRMAALNIEPGTTEAHTFMQATKELPALTDEQIAVYIRNGCTGQQGVRKIGYIEGLKQEFGNLPEDLVEASAERQLPSHLVRFLQAISQEGISYPEIVDAFSRYKGYGPLENKGRARETLYKNNANNYFVVMLAHMKDRELAQELLLHL